MRKEHDSPMPRVRALLIGQLDRSLAAILQPGIRDPMIHGIRKELKRARASLRLLREYLGEGAYRRENRVIRDAARPLAEARDSRVLVDTFSALRRADDAGSEKAFGLCVYRALQKERHASRQRLHGKRMSGGALGDARRRIAGMPVSQLKAPAISRGVQRVYKSGRRAFARARGRSTDTHLHEWRKQARYLSNQIAILSETSGGRFAKLRKRSDRLAECLGKDHDLAVLRRKMAEIASAEGLSPESRVVRIWVDRIRRERALLQAKALGLGEQVYSRRPKRVRAKILDGLGGGTSRSVERGQPGRGRRQKRSGVKQRR
jgi:CHAD domain-containing protein